MVTKPVRLSCNWHDCQLTLLPPRNEPRAGKEPLIVWVIRVWEENAPEGEEPLEWLLLTSVPTTTLEEAWEHVDWYRHRWLVEDYHQCLKSGCRIEQRQLQTVDGLIRLLGLLSPLAVRLLQLRAGARDDPERPVQQVIEPVMLAVVAQRSGYWSASMTLGTFWTEVARMGAIWHATGMALLDGVPFGKAGSPCKCFLRAFISLFTSNCKMGVRIRVETWGYPRRRNHGGAGVGRTERWIVARRRRVLVLPTCSARTIVNVRELPVIS